MNLQEAADRLEVHYQTAYRWVRQGVLHATKVASAYEVSLEEVDRFGKARLAPAAPPDRLHVRNWDDQISNLMVFLRAGEELEARLLVDRLFEGGVSTIEICEKLLTPTLRTFGEEWHDGSLTIAQEHRATAIIERMLGRLSGHPRGRPRGTVVVATPPNESHAIPALMAALVLRDDRWKVHHLGGGLSIEETSRMAQEVSADLVVFSPMIADPTETLLAELKSVHTRVLVGSPGSTLSDLITQARGLNSAI